MGVRYPIQRALYGNGNSVVCNADGSVDMFAANGQPVTTHEDRLRVTQGPIEQPGLSGVALSAAGEGRFWFDAGTNHWMYSENHGAATQAFGAASITANTTVNRVPYLSGANTYADSPVSVQSGMVGINLGSVAPPTMFTVGDTLNSTPRGLMSWQASTDANSAHFHLRKSRGTFAAPTVVVTADVMGRIVFSGYDGSAYNESAYIRSTVTGTVAANRVPSKMEFFTSTDAAPSVATVALTLNADQSANFVNTVNATTFVGALTGTASGNLNKTGDTLTGTAGAGFLGFPSQSSNPSTPGSGFVLFAESAGKLAYKRPDGFVRKFDFGSPTADRTITFTDADITVAGTNVAQTFSATQTFSSNSVIVGLQPASDSTTAIRVYKADGSTVILTVDSTNRTLTVTGTSGSSQFRITDSTNSKTRFFLNNNDDLSFLNNAAVRQFTLLSASGSAQVPSGGAFSFSSTTASDGTADTFLTRAAAANLRFGAADAAAPVAQTVSVQNVVAGTSNTAGVDWTFQGSQGTGTGAGGKFVFKGAPAGSTGTAQNALSTLFTIDPATGVTLGSGQMLLPDGSVSNPVIGFSSKTGNGIYHVPATDAVGELSIAIGGVQKYRFRSSLFMLTGPTLAIRNDSGSMTMGSADDVALFRDAANVLALRNGSTAQTLRVSGSYTDSSNRRGVALLGGSSTPSIVAYGIGTQASADGVLTIQNNGATGLGTLALGASTPSTIGSLPTHGQTLSILQAEESLTIAAAATTTTTMQIPANAVVMAVSVRVTTVIPTAATFTVKVGTTTVSTTNISTAAGTTDPGTFAGSFYNSTAQGVTITPNSTPGAATGVVRVTVMYYLVTPPTS
jgi:hypothetical protein